MTFDREWIIHHYDTLPSTMDRAALVAAAGARERTVVLSDEQTAGRGRAGRTWQSAPGAAISCTLILRPNVPPNRLSTLSLVIGMAVAEAIEQTTGAKARLKWPNDVWLGDDPTHQKVAGILLTSSLTERNVDYVLVGIGINVSTALSDLPPGATSLLATTGMRVPRELILDTLLERIDLGYETYLATAGRPSLAAWRTRAALLGEIVTIEDGDQVLRGIFSEVDDDGALLLMSPTKHVRRVVSGDLVRGPKPAPLEHRSPTVSS